MIEIKVIGITPSELKNMLVDFLKKNASSFNLKFDSDEDLTHEHKVWDNDGYGYSTWEYDNYSNKAWYMINQAIESENVLTIGLIGQKMLMTKEVYAFYHTELPRIILTYFDDYIESIKITSQPNKDIDKLHANAKR